MTSTKATDRGMSNRARVHNSSAVLMPASSTIIAMSDRPPTAILRYLRKASELNTATVAPMRAINA